MAVNPVIKNEEQVQESTPAELSAASETAGWRGGLAGIWRRVTLTGDDYPSRRIAGRKMFMLLLGMSALFGVMAGLAVVYSIDLPQMEDLAKYRPNTTTELLDSKGRLIGSFALERRVVIPYTDIPQNLQDAIISIEDKSFESNWGINLTRAVAAAITDLKSGRRAQGSSTLTMQLARNLFLSSQKTYSRKLQEMFLTIQIERRFTKQQIMTLYVNQIYLGHGRYGFEAGSEFYFSKHLKDLSLSEAALLAALPKGPELYSPIRNPEGAMHRRNLVLNEMVEDHKITAEQAAEAKAQPLGLKVEVPPISLAPYFVEEVRRQLEKEYGVEEVHGAGLRVYTTLDLDLQQVANKAVLDNLARYERRHGWKGNLQNVIAGGLDPVSYTHPDWVGTVAAGDYIHGMVTQASARSATVKLGRQTVAMTPEDWSWTQHSSADSFLKVGDLVYVEVTSMDPSGFGKAKLQEDTGAQGSMMAVNNDNGEVLAMVGGRDYELSQFNRATQSQRQVGSSFKIYPYTAAIEAGEKPTSIVVDAPTTFPTPSGPYTPHNYEPNYRGAMTLIQAFEESRNIPALRLAAKVGIRKVTQTDGIPLDSKASDVHEVISVDTARSMMVLLQAVIAHGTGSEAAVQLKHHPLGGKTGTTNDFTDAWFLGFSPSVTCGTWIGYDNRQTLGKGEQGAKAALPMWIDFMRAVIVGHEDETFSTGDKPKKLDVARRAVVSDADDAAPADDSAPDTSGSGDDGVKVVPPADKPANPSGPPTPVVPPASAPPQY